MYRNPTYQTISQHCLPAPLIVHFLLSCQGAAWRCSSEQPYERTRGAHWHGGRNPSSCLASFPDSAYQGLAQLIRRRHPHLLPLVAPQRVLRPATPGRRAPVRCYGPRHCRPVGKVATDPAGASTACRQNQPCGQARGSGREGCHPGRWELRPC